MTLFRRRKARAGGDGEAARPSLPGWTVPPGTPLLPNLMPQRQTVVLDGSWSRKYNIRGKDGH